jgi:signal transduction histidine kinase
MPIRDQERLLGTIEIAESLDVRDNYLRASIRNTAFATLAMVLVSGVVVLIVGIWLVGRPLNLLAHKAKRIGQGDLGEPLQLRQRDEIGQLVQEVNAMCVRLEEANAKTEVETSARIKAMEQLRHADRLITVGRLAAGIAHELGTPLNVVAGRVKMLRQDDIEPAVAKEYLSAVAEQTERIATIVRQMMEFARPREPRMCPTDLATIGYAIVRFVEQIATKRNVSVSAKSVGPVMALVDPYRVEQVVSNLVVNAIHACARGGLVEISCGICDEGQRKGKAYLRVADNGHGMTPEIKDRVFEPFFTTKPVGQGTGLGLSVAFGIVKEHDGEICVESEPGVGSTFTVYFAAAGTATAA